MRNAAVSEARFYMERLYVGDGDASREDGVWW